MPPNVPVRKPRPLPKTPPATPSPRSARPASTYNTPLIAPRIARIVIPVGRCFVMAVAPFLSKWPNSIWRGYSGPLTLHPLRQWGAGKKMMVGGAGFEPLAESPDERWDCGDEAG